MSPLPSSSTARASSFSNCSKASTLESDVCHMQWRLMPCHAVDMCMPAPHASGSNNSMQLPACSFHSSAAELTACAAACLIANATRARALGALHSAQTLRCRLVPAWNSLHTCSKVVAVLSHGPALTCLCGVFCAAWYPWTSSSRTRTVVSRSGTSVT